MIDLDPDLLYQLKLFAKAVIMPPHGFITLAFLGLLVARMRRGHGFGTSVALLALILLYLSVSPPVSRWLMAQVEGQAGPALDKTTAVKLMKSDNPPQAVVILGGGQTRDSRERPHANFLAPRALERVHAGARLARWTGLPVLTSAGKPPGSEISGAALMARVLKEDLLTAVRWTETTSRNTADNARMSAALLKRDKVTHVVLVTQAFHMARARAAFRAAGLTVTTAPVGFMSGQDSPYISYWIPRPESRERATRAWHELIGYYWYWFDRNYLGGLTQSEPAPASGKK